MGTLPAVSFRMQCVLLSYFSDRTHHLLLRSLLLSEPGGGPTSTVIESTWARVK